MGFVLDAIHKLVFEEYADEDGTELEVMVKPLTYGEWAALDSGNLTVEDAVQLFEEHLVSWNLENRDGGGDVVPVPADGGGIRSQDAMFIKGLVDRWARKIVDVNRPLGRRSTSGSPSLEASIPMEPLSESPPNLPMPN